ncbi:4-hydroxythreonine-4-phosphate dehydrogenase [Modicisalibacter ilicicola DSM 19980]|uniref:4-hydroxythreonine-4-phosphate dehydrogenase n=1 Tax=Modicisalibacter ilicicola DSM 19980 TaxID=1121942 RepID=A0A1M4XXI8_9GAMM|nr:4-hydroxythreonine-4-phosphate dehydrogenase PdxA [Halomonas ilicicola]SHE98150.1 4-hydroxythreonine-4-phosphate dehydrogenase [Halomonas ilicicola DSM 19980]
MSDKKHCIAVTLGDPAGIGPELVARLLACQDTVSKAQFVVVADRWLWQEGQRVAGTSHQLPEVESFAEVRLSDGPVLLPVETVARDDITYAQVGEAGGASVLKVLTQCMDAAQAGHIDAICFAPLNKLSMKQAGLTQEDELHFFADYLKVDDDVCEFNTLGYLWTSRISSHVPLKDAADYVTKERINNATRLIYESLQAAGVKAPRIAVAALNPHAGEGGTCGREEIDIIAPAIEECASNGYPAQGPFPADTIFIRARDGEFDGVVTMYHDQGQIAIKLLGFKSGVTVQGGLPIPITTPAHGTAFDIAGLGKADDGAMRHAFDIACRMGAAHFVRHQGDKLED